MIQRSTVQALEAHVKNQCLDRPLFNSQCVSDIPSWIFSALVGQGRSTLNDNVAPPFGASDLQRIVLVLLDGFGWETMLDHYDSNPFLRRCERQGIASIITSQFPSTTAANVTSLYTGRTIAQNRIYEWFQYETLADGLITPMLLQYAGAQGSDRILKTFEMCDIYPLRSFCSDLSEFGIRSAAILPKPLAKTEFTRATLRSAHVAGYVDLKQAIQQVGDATRAGDKYVLLYVSDIDRAAHLHGPGSAEHIAAVRSVLTAIEELPDALPGHSLLLLTSDHGTVSSDPTQTVNLDDVWPEAASFMKQFGKGVAFGPAGSPRDLFLHLHDESTTQDVVSRLSVLLAGHSTVTPVRQLVEGGVFGPAADHSDVCEKLGQIYVQPLPGETVWWGGAGYSNSFLGWHGGLTADEMTVPLISLLT